MDAIIALVVSCMGYLCCGIDFCTLFTFVSTALSLYSYTNEKLPNGR